VPETADLHLRIAALYPELLNIYADRGNLLLLERRCAWRGIACTITPLTLGDRLDPDAYDLVYLGGGQDRDQQLCAEDLTTVKADAMHAHAARGGTILAVCGGYQLLGHHYAPVSGEQIPGIGLLDLHTERGDGRLIGNVAIEVDGQTLAGFENHAGRTVLGAGQAPLGTVLAGHGNTGSSGFEGARTGNVIGTYLHGPLLPKNAWFADLLIATALGLDPAALAPLDDRFEDAAHAAARRAAGV
jgi:CobQ-like glutamine amidotransferase family enzyme